MRTCNCRKKDHCPLDNACLSRCIVYKATVETAENPSEDPKEYISLTATTFQERFNAHQHSIRHRQRQHNTALSKHILSFKDSNTVYSIKWSVHRKAAAYSNQTKRWNLCLSEKVAIITANKTRSLNRRTELVSKCRHQNKFHLCNFPRRYHEHISTLGPIPTNSHCYCRTPLPLHKFLLPSFYCRPTPLPSQ